MNDTGRPNGTVRAPSRRFIAALWPPVDTLQSARGAARYGTWAAVLNALGTTISVLLRDQAGPSWIDVILVLALAWAIQRMSRVAAVVCLVWYVLGRIPFLTGASPAIMAVRLILMACWTLALINGVRGTFAYHRLLKKPRTPGGEHGAAEQAVAADEVRVG
jgi:hypothetical protein